MHMSSPGQQADIGTSNFMCLLLDQTVWKNVLEPVRFQRNYWKNKQEQLNAQLSSEFIIEGSLSAGFTNHLMNFYLDFCTIQVHRLLFKWCYFLYMCWHLLPLSTQMLAALLQKDICLIWFIFLCWQHLWGSRSYQTVNEFLSSD